MFWLSCTAVMYSQVSKSFTLHSDVDNIKLNHHDLHVLLLWQLACNCGVHTINALKFVFVCLSMLFAFSGVRWTIPPWS